jgi:hypothetical protein
VSALDVEDAPWPEQPPPEEADEQPPPDVGLTYYRLIDRDGTLAAVHVRLDFPTGKRVFWQSPDGTRGLGGRALSSLPLYRLPFLAIRPDAEVYLCEGEKAADALAVAGYCSVGTVTGASTIPDADVLSVLGGRHVLLWPDNDDVGERHMDGVAARLDGVAASIAFVEWPDAPDHGDAADFVESHAVADVPLLPRIPYTRPPQIGAATSQSGERLSIGPTWRTLADISDEPPGPLLLGMLEPAGPALAYASPGVGKGTTGAWVIRELQRLGMRPMVYDAERRPREWARRVSGLGGDRSRVVYLEPPDLGPTYAGRPLWESAEVIRAVTRATGADLLIVDSVLPSVGLGEERLRTDAQVPYLYVQALDALGIPSLSFGHPPKGQPEGDPFGSFAWVGAMRLTWLGTAAEGAGHRIRWRPRKRNERGHIPGSCSRSHTQTMGARVPSTA